MKIAPTLLLALMLLTAGCHSQERPANVLSHDQMATILREFYINEQRLGNVVRQPDSARKDFVYLQKKILDSKNTSDSVFRASYNYYMEHPDELQEIYTAVIDSLQLMMQRSKTQ